VSPYFPLLNLFGLLVLGAAWLATVWLVFARRSSEGDDLMQRAMTIAGWLMVHLGALGLLGAMAGPVAIIAWPAFLLITAMAVGRYRHSERRSLLWSLALAAERGIPLEQAARAFAHERRDETGLRAARLAVELERGAPLPEALRRSRNPLPFDGRLACGVGWQSGSLGPALRRVIDFQEEFDQHLRHAIEKLAYLSLLLAAMCGVLTVLFARVVPDLSLIYSEFAVELPPFSQAVFAFGDAFALKWLWVAFVPVYFAVFVIVVASAFYYLGWLTWEPWLLRRLWRRLHTAWILRTLAFTVSQGRPMELGVRLLSANYPSTYIAQRLYAATGVLAGGGHWCEALRTKRLIPAGDAAVLRAAERSGNLAWALDELSESNLRRLAFRFRAFLSIVFPAAMLLCGALMFFLIVSLLLPLFSVFAELAE
jgi:type II secretory pathway component PulF